MATNSGYAAGIAKRNAASRLAWAMTGAPLRKRDLSLTPVGAIAEARKLRDSLSSKLEAAGLSAIDGFVAVVFATATSALDSRFEPIPVKPCAQREVAIASAHAEHVPLGLLLFVWDREERELLGHARPFIVEDPRSLELNAEAVRIFGKPLQRALERAEVPH